MASRIAVMNKGRLQQLDTPQVLYDQPANLFVAGFIGSPAMNFFNGKVYIEEGVMFVDMGSFRLRVPDHNIPHYESVIGKDIIFGIRPEDIHNPEFAPPGIIAEPVDVTIDVTELMGNEIFLYLVNGDHSFIARVIPALKRNMVKRCGLSSTWTTSTSSIPALTRKTHLLSNFFDQKRPRFRGSFCLSNSLRLALACQ